MSYLKVSRHPARTGTVEHGSSKGNLRCRKPLRSKEYVKAKQTEKTVRAAMRSREVELASMLGLLAVMSCKS
jgi:hypothetical protein